MNYVTGFIVTIFLMMGTLSLLGVIDGNTSQLLNAVGYNSPSGFDVSSLMGAIFNIWTLSGAAVGIVVGFFSYRVFESVLVAGIAGSITGWVSGDMLSIFNALNVISTDFIFVASVLKLLLFALLIGFAISMISWWRGTGG